MTPEERARLLKLATRHIEGALSEDQRASLEKLLESDETARRTFVDYLHDHALLHAEFLGEESATGSTPDPAFTRRRRVTRAAALLVGAAAVFLIAVTLMTESREESTFASVVKTHAAAWRSGDLPTSNGVRLSRGRLHLAEGLATLRFDSGAELTLESPAELELVDAMTVVLHRGTLVGNIPESAHGFKVETSSADVVDLGTQFAVHVDATRGSTRTQVFEGSVRVEHAATHEVVRLETGQQSVVAGPEMLPVDPGAEEGVWAPVEAERDRSTLVTTETGAGRDAYVHAVEIKNHSSGTLLLVKRAMGPSGPHRRAYLAFDLGQFDRERIAEAELILHFQATGWGLASAVPDSVFAVYGLTDPALDDWQRDTLTWENAPARSADGAAIDRALAVRLGTFVLPRGAQRGDFALRDARLAEFLREDTNAISTLVVVRETQETRSGGIVHGFASSRHPTLPAPTLALRAE